MLRKVYPLLFLAAPDEKSGGPGLTLEEQLTAANTRFDQAESARSTAAASLLTVTGERDGARSELSTLQTQFNALTADATKLRSDLTTTSATVSTVTGERDAARTSLGAAERNVSRLEGLCNVRGIVHADLPKAATDEGANDGEALYNAWKNLSGSDKTAFYRSNQKALDAYSDRLTKASRK